ncbi:methylthioribose kinase [Patella vulgata]|uniref:methylthioribose kinase n=1 Tax=Patella vulgata TaxID=6465 RepID=UPI0021802FC5|nr:methylthioribose kinase [Patella vulgata]
MAVDTEDIKQLVKSSLAKHSGQKGLEFAKNENDLQVEEISTGNLNNVFRIISKSKPALSVVVKHAPPYIKCLGPAYPLSTERGSIEFKAYQMFHKISPGSVPEPKFYDEENKVLCMEDLRKHVDYRKHLLAGNVDVKLAEALARHLGLVHSATHVSKIGDDEREELNERFNNSSLVSLTKQYVFTRPFSKGNPTNRCTAKVTPHLSAIYDDTEVLETAKVLRNLFQSKKECLIHGDLHTGSLIVTEQDVRMTDTEFAFVGPAAFDLGLLFANYIFCYYHHLSKSEDAGRATAFKVLDCCNAVSLIYQETITSFSGDNKEDYIKNLLSEAAGFAGCELIRRIVGAAHVEDTEDYPEVEPEILGAGIRLLKAYKRIHDVGTMLVIGLMLA